VKFKGSRPIIISIVYILIISAFVYYVYTNADKYVELMQISPLAVFSLMVISMLLLIVNGYITQYQIIGLGAKLSYRDGFLLAAASTLANQLPISGGLITKGLYLKRKHNLSYSHFFSSTLVLFFCFVAVNGLIGTAILLYRFFFNKMVISPVLWIGFIVMAACLLIFWLPLERINTPIWIRKWVNQAVEGWTVISKNPILVAQLVGLQTIMMLLLALRYWVAFHMLSQNVSPGDVVLFSSATVLTQLVSIAPGGVGIREAIVTAIASILGLDIGVSLVALGMDRLVETFIIMLIGGICTVVLGKQVSEPLAEHEKQDV